MTDAARIAMRPPELDEPARRLLWIVPAAIAIWAILLSGFSLILMRTKAPREELTPIEARLVEIPREVGGLQGGGGAIHPAAPAIPHPKSEPIVKPHPAAHVKKVAPAPPVIRSPYGTEKSTKRRESRKLRVRRTEARRRAADRKRAEDQAAESAAIRWVRGRFTRRRR